MTKDDLQNKVDELEAEKAELVSRIEELEQSAEEAPDPIDFDASEAIEKLSAYKVFKDRQRGLSQLTPAEKGVYDVLDKLQKIQEKIVN
jgi:predicted nuclease with TOPRIM domain